jgi:hypothetical protein
MVVVLQVLLVCAFVVMFPLAGVLIIRGRDSRERRWEYTIRTARTWDDVVGRDVGGIEITSSPYVWRAIGRYSSAFSDTIAKVVIGADENCVVMIRSDSIPYRKRLLTKDDPYWFVSRPSRLGQAVFEERRSGLSVYGAQMVDMGVALRSLGWLVAGV